MLNRILLLYFRLVSFEFFNRLFQVIHLLHGVVQNAFHLSDVQRKVCSGWKILQTVNNVLKLIITISLNIWTLNDRGRKAACALKKIKSVGVFRRIPEPKQAVSL